MDALLLILVLFFVPLIYLTIKLVRRKNVCLTLVYFAVMTYMACFTAVATGMLGFLWLVCWYILGLALFMSSVISITCTIKQLDKKTVAIKIASIVVALVCMIKFQDVNTFMRPKVFSLVVAQNERTAAEFMRNHPQGEQFISNDFRYPYHSVEHARVAHTNGILVAHVELYDRLAFVTPQGSTNSLPKDAKHLYGSWHIYKDYGRQQKSAL